MYICNYIIYKCIYICIYIYIFVHIYICTWYMFIYIYIYILWHASACLQSSMHMDAGTPWHIYLVNVLTPYSDYVTLPHVSCCHSLMASSIMRLVQKLTPAQRGLQSVSTPGSLSWNSPAGSKIWNLQTWFLFCLHDTFLLMRGNHTQTLVQEIHLEDLCTNIISVVLICINYYF